MNKILALLLILTISSCSTSGQIKIPDNIKVGDISSKQRIGNTRVVIDENANYKFIPDIMRLQKSQNQYLQIIEIPNQDYSSTIINIINKFNTIEAQGGNIRLKKEFKLGKFNAFLALAPQGSEEQIAFAFGDKSFSVLIMGVYPNNEKDRKEVVDYVLTAYLDKSIKTNLQEQLNFDLSLKNTTYKLSTVNGVIAIYTENGDALSNKDWQKNYFIVSILPKPSGFSLKQYSDKMIERLGQNNFEEKRISIEVLEENELSFDNIEVEMKGKTISTDLLLYQNIKLTSDGLIQFIGLAFNDKEKQIETFKSIVKTIKKK